MEKFVHKTASIESPVKLYQQTHVGSYSNIGKYTYIRPFSHVSSSVSIGRFCSIAERCSIGVNNHPTDWLSVHTFQYDTKTKFENSPLYEEVTPLEYRENKHTVIGNDVWIGTNAIVIKGVTIGDGAIIGANAVITKNVPPYAIVVGANKITRYRFTPEQIEQLLELKWWNLPESEIGKIKSFDQIDKAISEISTIRENVIIE